MRRRTFIVFAVICVMLIVAGTLWAFSSARSVSHMTLPQPVTTSTTPATSDVVIEPSPSSTTTTSKPVKASATKATKSVPRGNPVKVQVTRRGKVYIDEKISKAVGLTFDNGKKILNPPDDTVGWYEQGRWKAKPGQPGPSVLVAHISHKGKPGPFWELTQAAKGDRVTVTYNTGDHVTFVVTSVEHPKKVELPQQKIWSASVKKPVLRLITCDPSTPFSNGHYSGNVLVYADQMV